MFTHWFREQVYAVEAIPPRYRLDGGNLLRLPSGDVLAGLKPRAAGLGERYLRRLLELTTGRVLSTVALADKRYLHLDTVVGMLGEGHYVVHADGLRDGLPQTDPLAEGEVIEVGPDDAGRFACNLVVVGDVVITEPISASLPAASPGSATTSSESTYRSSTRRAEVPNASPSRCGLRASQPLRTYLLRTLPIEGQEETKSSMDDHKTSCS